MYKYLNYKLISFFILTTGIGYKTYKTYKILKKNFEDKISYTEYLINDIEIELTELKKEYVNIKNRVIDLEKNSNYFNIIKN